MSQSGSLLLKPWERTVDIEPRGAVSLTGVNTLRAAGALHHQLIPACYRGVIGSTGIVITTEYHIIVGTAIISCKPVESSTA